MEKLERASELINQNMGLEHNLNDNFLSFLVIWDSEKQP